MFTYLERLTAQLAFAIGQLPEPIRERHTRYLLQAQREDGGFAGREGASDLYYTGFALRGLAILGKLEGTPASQAASFLRGKLGGRESIADFLSLVYGAVLLQSSAQIDVFSDAASDWKTSVATMLNRLRRDDGGYAKGPEGRASSSYHTFLVLLCLELLDIAIPDTDGIFRFIRSQRAEEGGFLEIRASKRAGTNPTAAAIGCLKLLGRLDDDVREQTIDFLSYMQTDEGGLRANTRIPIADLLSTFTGVLTLGDLGAPDAIDRDDALRFVQSLELDEGGFHGAVWDDAHDVEYTFYGLGALALLQPSTPTT